MEKQTIKPNLCTIIFPVYNEAENLPGMYEELCEALNTQKDFSWEILAVDDHSSDETSRLLREFSQQDPRFHYLRLSRNEGSHIAIVAGLLHAGGSCAVVMAADQQDDPEEIKRMLDYWRRGYHTVWMVRDTCKQGYHPSTYGKLWYRCVRHLPGLQDMPPTGSDMFLVDRKVIEALRKQDLRKVAIPLLIRSLGFRQINLLYTKRPRGAGTSKWTLGKKIRHMKNTIMAFTNIPIRIITTIGFSLSGLALLYSVFLFIHKIMVGKAVTGWHSLMIFSALSFSLTMLLIGILGEYIWRIFEASRHTPYFIVEETSEEQEERLPAPRDSARDDRDKSSTLLD